MCRLQPAWCPDHLLLPRFHRCPSGSHHLIKLPSILLIEDEAALAMIVKDSLEARGFTVRLAADGQAGLRLFREAMPDIVVTDVMMPLLDGFSLAERIRREHATVPILFLTARSQPRAKARSRR